ncbi:MAG: hypothetical protein H8D67_22545 [Deltaproteobacteria bacterium]|nr:hypothetical protein [Deltaproteobacteria bacterium]
MPAKRWEHKIITVNFHIEFVQRRKLFDWSIGMQLRSLYEKPLRLSTSFRDTRIRGDYKPNLVVTEKLARERFILAEKILQQIVEVIQK